VAAAERSLARLGVDAIDLYQVHGPNPGVPLAATMSGMQRLLQAGKVGAVGVSNFPLRLWRRADEALGRATAADQVPFHLLDRRPLDFLLPHAQRHGRVIIAYSPLHQGILAGSYDATNLPRDSRATDQSFARHELDQAQALVRALAALGERYEATAAQIALAWLIHLPNVIAIPGARTVEQLEMNAAAADIALAEADWQALTRLSRQVKPDRRGRGLKRLLARLFPV
jgi:aryl-alcohol dehydrogenase-like predicted oxidoreductase